MSDQAARTLLWTALVLFSFICVIALTTLGTISEITAFVFMFFFSALVAVLFAGR